MDDYMFKYFVDECRVVEEKTSYIEIFNYSVSCVFGIYAALHLRRDDICLIMGDGSQRGKKKGYRTIRN